MLFGSPNPNLRVPATLAAVLDPTKYEALTLVDGERRWQTERPPTDSETEARLVNEGKLKPDDAHFLPADAANPTDLIRLHRGSVRWNAYRKKWVLIAVQFGGKSSHLGEVWYAEAAAPTGPFRTAVKIAGHDRMTFYNPVHHPWLDRDGGRTIHFEGTYTNDFSGNPEKTPRYNYNQMLYRLDLEAPALKPAQQGK